jgi:oligosaccharide repeat unit polymerase
MPYLALTSILLFCVVIGRLRSRQWINAITAFSGVWLASLVVLGLTSESSLEYITWQATALIATVHIAFAFGFWTFYLPNQHRRRRAAAAGESANSNSAMTLWLTWFCVATAAIGVGALLQSVYGWSGISPAAMLYARDSLGTGALVLPLGGRIASNFAYPAAVLCPVIALRSQTWKSYLIMLVPLVILLGLCAVTGGRGPLLIGVGLMGWVVLATDATGKTRKTAKRSLAAVAMVALGYCVFVAENRESELTGMQSIAEYVSGPVPAFSAWLRRSSSLPVVNFNILDLAPIREIRLRAGGDQTREVDSNVVYVPFRFNVFTCLAEHLLDFGLVGTVLVWSAIGAGAALLQRSRPGPMRAAMLSVMYTYLSWSLMADLAFLVTGWLLAAVLVYWLAFIYQPRRRFKRSLAPDEADNLRRLAKRILAQ